MQLAKKFGLKPGQERLSDERNSVAKPLEDVNSTAAETDEDTHTSKSKFSRVLSMGKAKLPKAPMNLMSGMPSLLRKSKDSDVVVSDVNPQQIQRVMSLIDDFKLIQSEGADKLVIAVSRHCPLIDSGVTFSWFRMNPLDNRFLPIEGKK